MDNKTDYQLGILLDQMRKGLLKNHGYSLAKEGVETVADEIIARKIKDEIYLRLKDLKTDELNRLKRLL